MMKREWKNIFHNAWIIIVIIAIILIPSIYACVFLGSMWDPYGNTGNIPVAVVNNDKEVSFNDKTLAVGEELVKNLKDNDAMDFHFVNKEDADKGLENGDYYMIITIPSDFSKNATTLLDDNPKKMILSYTTNPGTNYIASKMDDSAVTKIKDSVSATITKTYAETIFNSVTTLTDGLKQASDGTTQLVDGTQQLVDGNKLISNNLKVLASSSLTFKDGANTFNKGLKDYTDGVSTVNNGLLLVQNGVGQLSNATPTLQQGIGQLNTGAQTLKTGINTYTAGVSQTYAGTQQLVSNNKTLLNGVNQLSVGSKQLVAGNKQVVDGLVTVSKSLEESLSETNQKKLTAATSSNDSLALATSLMTGLVTSEDTKAVGTYWLTNKLDKNTAMSISNVLVKQNPKLNKESIVGLLTNYSYNSLVTAVTKGNKEAINQLQMGIAQFNIAVNGGNLIDENGKEVTTPGLLMGSKTVQAGLSNIDAAVNGGTYDNNDGTQTKIPSDKSLKGGIIAYSQGVEQVNAGLSQLNANTAALTSGANQLANGTESLNKQTPTLVSGIKALDSGVSQLFEGTQTLVSNNNTLVDGANQLSNGAIQIASGAHQLADGSITLGSGLTQVNDGVKTLNTSLKDGVDKAQIKTTDATYDMVATPIETNHNETSIVENNGHAMAPYMMSVALYVAALAFTLMYPIRHGIKEADNGFKYWATKASVMYTVSTVAAIVLISALRLINGFEPQQLGMTYLFAILTSAAFMSLVALLSLTTGYIGEFLLLVFMIFNLGGSAGTYPLETSSAFFKAIHPFVPYTYTVNGFRKVISMTSSVSSEMLILIGILIVSSLLTIIYFNVKNKEDKHLIPGAFEAVNEIEHKKG